MISHRTAAAAILLAGLSAPVPALAQNVIADPARISAILTERKMPVELKTDSQGDPMINTQFEDEGKFTIYFYGCTAGKNCQSVQFLARYTESKAGAAEMLSWNSKYRYTRAYLDGNDEPEMAMDISLDAGGISPALFKVQLDNWDSAMVEFGKLIYPE